jgi:hypothetical protein
VPIREFIADNIFDPELIEIMSRALADACLELGLEKKDDAAVRLLALRIIDQAKQGNHDAALLKAAATAGLQPSRKH